MRDLTIVPHQAIGPLRLGDPRIAVRAVAEASGLVLSRETETMDYFVENALQVEYEAGFANFIGASGNPGAYRAVFAGRNVFDTPARTVFSIIAAAEGGPVGPYQPDEVLFPRQIVTLWDADTQYDYVRRDRGGLFLRSIWGQVGIGTAAYLEATT